MHCKAYKLCNLPIAACALDVDGLHADCVRQPVAVALHRAPVATRQHSSAVCSAAAVRSARRKVVCREQIASCTMLLTPAKQICL